MKGIAVGIVALLVFYLGYQKFVSIPDVYVDESVAISKLITNAESRINTITNNADSIKKGKDWSFFSPYAKREAWEQKITSANTSVKAARALFNEEIIPIIDNDHEDDLKALKMHMQVIRTSLFQSLQAAKIPSERAKILMTSFKNKEAYFTTSKKVLADIKSRIKTFNEGAAKSANKHPSKKSDIAKRTNDANHIASLSTTINNIIVKEYSANNTDFSLYGKAYSDLHEQQKLAKDFIQANNKLLGQLNRSYVKTLKDQKIDYYVVVKRSSWDSYSDWDSSDDHAYKAVKVDDNTFEYFDSLNIGTIATLKRVNIPSNRWKTLSVNLKERWCCGDDEAEYWIENAYSKTYHQYIIVENGTVKETPWTSVDEDYFWNNYDNLGMALITKPYGFYDKESNNTAQPPGLAMVAKPNMVNGVPTGSNQYGQWQTNNGNSFFHYYGMYSMFSNLSGGGRYGYNDWDHYNSRDRNSSYYGKSKQYGTYGSKTTSNPTFKNSSFAKRNPSVFSKTGKVARSTSSVRGAGAASRGKGPGKNGK